MWLQKQHIHGIDKTEALRYILEGASARSAMSEKLLVIDLAISKANIAAGAASPIPAPTLGYQRTLSDEDNEILRESRESARKNIITSGDPIKIILHENELHYLEIAKQISSTQLELVRKFHFFVCDN